MMARNFSVNSGSGTVYSAKGKEWLSIYYFNSAAENYSAFSK